MSRRHLLPPENEEYLDRLGLTEEDKLVYVSTLDNGLVTVGEINQLTDLDLEKVLTSIRDLTDIGLLKRTQGKMPRYFGILPFFRETVSVEKETIYAVDSILNAMEQSSESVNKKSETLFKEQIPNLSNLYLDSVYKQLLIPVIKEFEDLNGNLIDNSEQMDKLITTQLELFNEKASKILAPIIDFIKLRSKEFEIKLMQESNALEDYTMDHKNNHVKILTETHNKLKKVVEQERDRNKEFSNKIDHQMKQIQLLLSPITNFQKVLNSTLKEIESSKRKKNELKEKASNNFAQIESTLSELEIEGKQALIEKIKDLIKDQNELEKSSNENLDLLQKSLNSAVASLDENFNLISNSLNTLEENSAKIKSAQEDAHKFLVKNLGDALNSLKEQDDVSLGEFQSLISDEINSLNEKLIGNSDKSIIELNNKQNEISNSLNEELASFSQRYIDSIEISRLTIQSFLDGWAHKIEPIVSEFQSGIENEITELSQEFQELNKSTGDSIQKHGQIIKTILEVRNEDLQSITEFSKSFGTTRSADTWVVVGLPLIYATLTDLLLRTKSTVTVVLPKVDFQMVEVIKTLKTTTRITIVAEFDPDRDKRIIEGFKQTGRINLRLYTGKDLYACLRDREEIIFGYQKDDEVMVGIRTLTPSIVGLLEDRLNETVIRNSKQF